jgi:microspherule protein 1
VFSPSHARIAVEAMKALPPGVVTMALNNALWSVEEEAVLARIPSTDPGHLETFQSLLKAHPSVFHSCRTPTSLHHHWVLMGHYRLLNNQKIDLIPPGDTVVNFTDAEDQLNDNELVKPRDVKEEALEQELMASERHVRREIMRLEEEIPQWRTIIDTGAMPEFSSGVYAILKGNVVEFMMKSQSVTLGRSSAAGQVDFDLSLEAPAFKISRKQATIRLTSDGEFILHNEGQRPVYLGGKAVVSGKSAKLQHQHILEISTMSFLVLLNFALVQSTISTAS